MEGARLRQSEQVRDDCSSVWVFPWVWMVFFNTSAWISYQQVSRVWPEAELWRHRVVLMLLKSPASLRCKFCVLPGVSFCVLNPKCCHKYLKLEATEYATTCQSRTRWYYLTMKTSIILLIMVKLFFYVDIALGIEVCMNNINQGACTNE